MLCAELPPLLAFAWDTQLTRWIVWGGLVVLTLAILILIRTRWGQSQPLSKCVVLSLLAHLLLGIYLTTINIVTSSVGAPDGTGIQIALVEGSPDGTESRAALGDLPLGETTDDRSWLPKPDSTDAVSKASLSPAELSAPPTLVEPERKRATIAEPTRAPVVRSRPSEQVGAPEASELREPVARPLSATAAEQMEVAETNETDTLKDIPPPDPAPAKSSASPGDKGSSADPAASPSASPPETDANGAGKLPRAQLGAGGSPQGTTKIPGALRERVGDHVRKGQGATEVTEAAVNDALAWLAANQRAVGRWDARSLGAGSGRAADGEERQAAGLHADSGLSGLALLAFLAGGHTHTRGAHQATVRRGLEFLLSVQDTEGCLAATANRYERMYCHAMATCALSEAFAMTSDARLQPAVRKALDYTIRAQDRVTGGWRYQPSDPGDTSQLGWQLMALKSAELAGVPIPQSTRDGATRFLRSVAVGRNGGLACYQAARPIASRSMTAEALTCRQFLGIVDPAVSNEEATSYLLQELPGSSTTNYYYWYYATLALYQTQGDAWSRWNDALQPKLLAAQRHDAGLAGSWDPDPVWGGCGGRVYSTSLATLCLEVYYRFLPLYVDTAVRQRAPK
jgi:hypothetical protein